MDRRNFQQAYATRRDGDDAVDRVAGADGGSPRAPAWEIDRPQPVIERLVDEGVFRGRILDSGCGTGANAILLAAHGHEVVAFDFVDLAIERAIARASGSLDDEARARVRFLQADALALGDEPELAGPFDVVLDSGVLHTFDRDERARYAAQLAPRLARGGRIVSVVFRDDEPGDHGPYRMTRTEVEQAFAPHARACSIEHARYAVRPEHDGSSFSAGGAKAWLAWWERPS